MSLDLAERARHIRTFAGMALHDDTSWERLEALVDELLTDARPA